MMVVTPIDHCHGGGRCPAAEKPSSSASSTTSSSSIADYSSSSRNGSIESDEPTFYTSSSPSTSTSFVTDLCAASKAATTGRSRPMMAAAAAASHLSPSTTISTTTTTPMSPTTRSVISRIEGLALRNHLYHKGSSRDAIGQIRLRDDFEVIKFLGSGFFADVYLVRSFGEFTDEPEISVMKVAKIKGPDVERARLCAKKEVEKEACMLTRLKHDNIVGFRCLCIERCGLQWSIHLVTDFCDRGTLQQAIINHDSDFPWLQRCLFARDVSSGMSYVHECGFMHRDLTATNVLIQTTHTSPFPKAVVADFGLSSPIPQPGRYAQQAGTENYMSPEMLHEKPYNEKSDVFSFGIILCQMIARINADPDDGLSRTNKFGLDYTGFAEKCPPDTPVNFLLLAFKCCRYDASTRPSFASAYEEISKLVEDDLRKWNVIVRHVGAIGRSLSDAELKSAAAATAAAVAQRPTSGTPTIVEGAELDECSVASSLSAVEQGHIRKIAERFSVAEPRMDSKSPFRGDGRIRNSCRKMKPFESFNRRRFSGNNNNNCSLDLDDEYAKVCGGRKKFVQSPELLPSADETGSSPGGRDRRRRRLYRSISEPSMNDLSSSSVISSPTYDEQENAQPMDSHSDMMKKMSLNYAFGLHLSTSQSRSIGVLEPKMDIEIAPDENQPEIKVDPIEPDSQFEIVDLDELELLEKSKIPQSATESIIVPPKIWTTSRTTSELLPTSTTTTAVMFDTIVMAPGSQNQNTIPSVTSTPIIKRAMCLCRRTAATATTPRRPAISKALSKQRRQRYENATSCSVI